MTKPHGAYGRVLVVDDDADMLAVLQSTLEFDGFRVETCQSLDHMKEKIRRFSFDAILLDLRLGDELSVEALPYLVREAPFAIVIVMSAFGSIELAVEAMGKGAASFIAKSGDPGKIVDELKQRIEHRAAAPASVPQIASELIGQSAVMRDVVNQIIRFKDTDATVLITGESGTGKEIAARAIHGLSPRAGGNFAALNCAAIPENLLESELFGHKRGAFTDAKTDRKGIFETCTDGTLLLDEIGEMPLSLQAKLLRVLQEKEVTPVGATRAVKIGTRVLAATNRDLDDEVARGRFREDLFFRLNVLSLYMPPLRERQGDIKLLADAFIAKFNERYGRQVEPVGRDVLLRLEAYGWPGNIRELQNAIERAVVLAQGPLLQLEDVLQRKLRKKNAPQGASGAPGSAEDAFNLSYSEAKEGFEKAFLLRILAVARGSIAEAARISGRYRSDIYRLLERYKVDVESFKE